MALMIAIICAVIIAIKVIGSSNDSDFYREVGLERIAKEHESANGCAWTFLIIIVALLFLGLCGVGK